MRRALARLLSFLGVRKTDEELTREIESHVSLIEDDLIARGMSRGSAHRAARLSFGGIEQTKERHRDTRSFVWLEDVRQDCIHGIRLLRRSPLFAVTAAMSLAIGIGGNIAIFNVVNSVLFRPAAGIVAPEE